MSSLLLKVLEMSMYGSIAILVVLVFRFLFRKLPKRLTIVFWLAVALRLMCPYNFSAPTSVMNIEEIGTVQTKIQNIVRIEATDEVWDPVTNNIVPAEQLEQEQSPKIPIGIIVAAVWSVGTAGMLLYFVIKSIGIHRFVKSCHKSEDGKYLLSDDIDSPFVTGYIRPRICLPSTLDESEREYILMHEMTHIKNHDGIIKSVAFIVLSFHWFNPLAWLAFFMLYSDIEMRVDEEVTENMDSAMKKAYCLSIVNHAVMEPLPSKVQESSFSGVGFGGMEAKMRVHNLLFSRKVPAILAFLVLLITIGVSVLASACALDKDPVQTVLTEATELIAPVPIEYKNEDNYNYKENPALRELVGMFVYEGLRVSTIERVYDLDGNFGHRVTLVDDNGEIKQIVTDVTGLNGVLAEFDFPEYEGVEVEDCYISGNGLEFHPVKRKADKVDELFIEDHVIVTTYS